MPARRGILDLAQTILFALILVLVPICLYVIFAVVPTESRMGVIQRIFYFHVPSAICAFLGVGVCAVASALYLWKRDRRFDILAHAGAELAVVFCSIVLISGPIWARPVWGVWWTGEARLTSTLVLWLIFVGYLVLRGSADNPDQAARWGAVVAIVGALDVPIIYKSVAWWRGLHPRVLKATGGQGLDPTMERTLMLCMLTFVLLFTYLVIQRWRLGRLQDEVQALLHTARRGPAPAARA